MGQPFTLRQKETAMLGLTVLIAFLLPWLMIILLAVLIWKLRARRVRALLALAALILLWLTNAREFLYAIGLPLPYPDEPGGALREVVGALEWYRWQILALACVAAAALALPLPGARGQRLLAILTVLGLAISAALAWSLTGLRFN